METKIFVCTWELNAIAAMCCWCVFENLVMMGTMIALEIL